MDSKTIKKYFKILGNKHLSLFSTPDNRVFIKQDEAKNHCREMSLNSQRIQEWFHDGSLKEELYDEDFQQEPESLYEDDEPNFQGTLEYIRNKFDLI